MADTTEAVKIVGLTINGQEFCIEAENFVQLLDTKERKVMSRDSLCRGGILSCDGTTLPIIDLRKVLHLSCPAVTSYRRKCIAVLREGENIIALAVDGARHMELDVHAIYPPPALVRGLPSDCVKAVAKVGAELLVILDPGVIVHKAEPRKMPKAA